MKNLILILNYSFGALAVIFFVLIFIFRIVLFNDSGKARMFDSDPISIFFWSFVVIVLISILISHLLHNQRLAIIVAFLPIILILIAVFNLSFSEFKYSEERKINSDIKDKIILSASKDFICPIEIYGGNEDKEPFLITDKELNVLLYFDPMITLSSPITMIGLIDDENNLRLWNNSKQDIYFKNCLNKDGKNISEYFKIIKDIDNSKENKFLWSDVWSSVEKKYNLGNYKK